MNVLILGSGGREHAIAFKIAQSPNLNKLFVAPGNAGTEQIATNLNLSLSDFDQLKVEVLDRSIDLVIVGPEAPLVDGVSDFFIQDEELKKIPVIGPQKMGAQLEGSKDFSKEFMQRHGIPTAGYKTFTKDELEAGKSFLNTLKPPYVLKADGLAAGKGVLIIQDLEEAHKELENMLIDAKFGDASSRVVIEEFLDGIELSTFVLTDGKNYKILPSAKDYKRIGEGDTGLNTGGMGAISPVPFASEEFLDKVEQKIVIPTVEGLKKDKIPFVGFLFIGLMNVDGEPFVIEYNVRMGDPETEVVFPRLDSDVLDMFAQTGKGNLGNYELKISINTAVTVMSVAGGYPESYEKGDEISGLTEMNDVIVFHAGTKRDGDKILTNGGRVFATTAFGKNYKEALTKAYQELEKSDFKNRYYRRDLGFDLS